MMSSAEPEPNHNAVNLKDKDIIAWYLISRERSKHILGVLFLGYRPHSPPAHISCHVDFNYTRP